MNTTHYHHFAEIQEFGDDTWYILGSAQGYADRCDAERAIRTRIRQSETSRMFRPVAAARIRTDVTTSTYAPYVLH